VRPPVPPRSTILKAAPVVSVTSTPVSSMAEKRCVDSNPASHTRGVLTHVLVFRISRRMSFGRSQAQQMIAAAAAVVTRGPDVSSLTDDINAKAAFKYNPLLEEQVSVPIVDQIRLAIDRHRLRVHLGCVIQRRHRDGCAACWASCWTRAEPSSAPSRTACCSARTRCAPPHFFRFVLVGSPRTPL
jgi:hypothetical protein